MKRMYMSAIMITCLFITGIAGFSNVSWAGAFHCNECNQLYDEKAMWSRGIANEYFCTACYKKIFGGDEQTEPSLDQDNVLPLPPRDDKPHSAVPDKKNAEPDGTDCAVMNCVAPVAKKIQFDNELPDLSEILPIGDSTEFLIALITAFGEAPRSIPEQMVQKIKQLQNTHATNILPSLQRSIAGKMKIGDMSFPYVNQGSHDLLPDFFALQSETPNNPPLLLFERKTTKTIQYSLERILGSKHIRQECFHLIIRDNRGHKPIKDHILLISKNNSGTFVLHFFDLLSQNWYTLKGENLLSFVISIETWATKRSYSAGIYTAIENLGIYTHRADYQETGFDDTTLQLIIKKLYNGDPPPVLKSVKNRQDCLSLSQTKDKITSHSTKKVATPFIEWYPEAWLNSRQDEKTFVVELVGAVPDMANPMIILTPLDASHYGLSVHEDNNQYYRIIHKSFMKLLTKQFMWIADDIKVHEITP